MFELYFGDLHTESATNQVQLLRIETNDQIVTITEKASCFTPEHNLLEALPELVLMRRSNKATIRDGFTVW